jgi:hypothetical protein
MFRSGYVGHRALLEKNAGLRLQQGNRCDRGTVGWEPPPPVLNIDKPSEFAR